MFCCGQCIDVVDIWGPSGNVARRGNWCINVVNVSKTNPACLMNTMGIIVTNEASGHIFKIIHFSLCTPRSSFNYNGKLLSQVKWVGLYLRLFIFHYVPHGPHSNTMGIIFTSKVSDLIFKIINFPLCIPWSPFKYNANYCHKWSEWPYISGQHLT